MTSVGGGLDIGDLKRRRLQASTTAFIKQANCIFNLLALAINIPVMRAIFGQRGQLP